MKKNLFCLILLIFCSALFGADFTFIQTGGEHFSAYPQSEETVKSIKHRKDYIFRDMLFPKPSFIIETGNITELGDTENFADIWEKTYNYLGLPHYYVFGNRDMTWNPMTSRKENINSSFDFGGVHFILLNSCGLLDSRPCFAEETLNFLQNDLMQTNSATPLILVFHHSWGGDEWSDPLDWERIKDMTRSYNLIACLTGHGEKPECVRYERVPLICGGSAYGKERGYMVHNITDGIFRSLYMNEETGSLTLYYEKDLKTKNKKPEIVFLSPKPGEETEKNIEIKIKAEGRFSQADLYLDNIKQSSLAENGNIYSCNITAETEGGHSLRAVFTEEQTGIKYTKSAYFYLKSPKVKWRVFLSSSSKASPLETDGRVYIAATDGRIYSFSADTGKHIRSFDTGAPIYAQNILLDNNRIIVGNIKGKIFILDTDLKKISETQTGHPIYTGFAKTEKGYVCGGHGGYITMTDREGKVIFSEQIALTSIESTPTVIGNRIYFGAWDCRVYCIDTEGRKIWNTFSRGPLEKKNEKRIYSPANAPFAFAGDSLFVCDGAGRLSVINQKGEIIQTGRGMSVLSHGDSCYVRDISSISEANSLGQKVWETDTEKSYISSYPLRDKKGNIYIVSDKGLLSAFSPEGKLLFNYRSTPNLPVWASPGVGSDCVYIIGSDGSLTSVTP